MPGSISVALLGAPGLSKELAKKSTESDLTLYHLVQDGHAVTLIEPTQYPEKFAPLLYSLALADRVLLVVTALDRSVAETLATLDLVDRPVELRHGDAVGEEELRRVCKGLRFEGAPVPAVDVVQLRAELQAMSVAPRPGPVMVGLDHHFPVKGVGTVALGFVRQGTLQAHQTLRLFPTTKSVEVRSIQVHDVDVKEAPTGERVGIALKGVEVDELARGQVLAPDGALEVGTELRGRGGRKNRYYKGDLRVGAQLHALVGAQFVPAGVTALEGDTLTVEPDRPVAYAPGEAMILADLSAAPGPRAVGRWTL